MLGASNLTRALPTAISLALSTYKRPIAFYVAKGHGRSYGKVSNCLGRKIPGIFQCGIWRTLPCENRVPIYAWLTDIGNDLAYEEPVQQVLGWVEACVDRLQTRGARIVIADLPIDVLKTINTTQYRVMRSLLFPHCRLDWPTMLRRAEQLSQHLHTLAKTRKLSVFTGENSWYGWDPIHPRRKYLGDLWRGLLQPVLDQQVITDPNLKGVLWGSYVRGLRPEQWSFLSFSRRASQPQGKLHDGSRIFLY